MARSRTRDLRRVSRALLAGATIIAALGAISVRLTFGVLVGPRNAVLVGAGALGWQWHEPGLAPIAAARWGPFILDRNDDPLEWWPMTERGPDGDGIAAVPLWMPLGAMLVPGVWLAIHHRLRSGCCPRCNYDLAGLDPSSPCPECGLARPPTRATPNVSSAGESP